MPVSPLAIIVAGPDPARARTALALAAAAAALGREAALLFDGDAVLTLEAAAEPLAAALALGARVTACVTGLADHGIDLPGGCEPGGMLSFLSLNRDAQLLTV